MNHQPTRGGQAAVEAMLARSIWNIWGAFLRRGQLGVPIPRGSVEEMELPIGNATLQVVAGGGAPSHEVRLRLDTGEWLCDDETGRTSWYIQDSAATERKRFIALATKALLGRKGEPEMKLPSDSRFIAGEPINKDFQSTIHLARRRHSEHEFKVIAKAMVREAYDRIGRDQEPDAKRLEGFMLGLCNLVYVDELPEHLALPYKHHGAQVQCELRMTEHQPEPKFITTYACKNEAGHWQQPSPEYDIADRAAKDNLIGRLALDLAIAPDQPPAARVSEGNGLRVVS